MDYYIDLLGNDKKGDGTEAKPWKTFEKAIKNIPNFCKKEPYKIHIGEGEWELSSEINKLGNLGEVAPLVLAGKEKDLSIEMQASSGTKNTITVNGAGWTPHEFKDKFVYVMSGAGKYPFELPWIDYSYARIIDNDSDTLTVPENSYDATTKFKIIDQISILKNDGSAAIISQNLCVPSSVLTFQSLVFDITDYKGTRPYISSSQGNTWINACKFLNSPDKAFKYLGVNFPNNGFLIFVQSLMKGKIRHGINVTGANNFLYRKSEIDSMDSGNFLGTKAAIEITNVRMFNVFSGVVKGNLRAYLIGKDSNAYLGGVESDSVVDTVKDAIYADEFSKVRVSGTAFQSFANVSNYTHVADRGAHIITKNNLSGGGQVDMENVITGAKISYI